MPTWLIELIEILGVPIVRFVLTLLENRYPGIAPYLDTVLQYLKQIPEEGRSVALMRLHTICKGLQEQPAQNIGKEPK